MTIVKIKIVTFEYSKEACKYLKRSSKKNWIKDKIKKFLGFYPPSGDISLLNGVFSGKIRLHIGDFRVIFEYKNNYTKIKILKIGPRGDVYK